LLFALCGGFLGRLAVQDRDMRAGLQIVLSVDHDLLVGLEAGVEIICSGLSVFRDS